MRIEQKNKGDCEACRDPFEETCSTVSPRVFKKVAARARESKKMSSNRTSFPKREREEKCSLYLENSELSG